MLAQNGDDEKATAEFREAVRICPDYDAHANLGAVQMLANVDEAIVELEKTISLDPTWMKAQFNLAEAYGNSPATCDQTNRAIEKGHFDRPDCPRTSRFGQGHAHDAKVNDAVIEIREATRLNPASGEAHYQLGLALARNGQKKAAAEVKKGRDFRLLTSATKCRDPYFRKEGPRCKRVSCRKRTRISTRHQTEPNSFAAQHILR